MMDVAGSLDGLALLPSVDLVEMDAMAGLLTRRDRKYIVPGAVADRLLEDVAGFARVLEIEGMRSFRYESVYFDTPERISYLTAAWRRPRRFKVRTRAYLDTGHCVLEVKTRDPRGRTVKFQHAHDLDRRTCLDGTDRAVVADHPEIGASGSLLQPALTTRYRRSTLLLDRDEARVTLDRDVAGMAPDGRTVTLEGMVIIETKSAGCPGEVDRLLWRLGCRPVRVSKFATSLAALQPELPSNRWTRALGKPWRVHAAARLATETPVP